MNVYDRVHLLAQDIKETQEYKDYKRLKEEVMAEESNKALIKQYKKLQFEAQAAMMTGQNPSSELNEQIKKLSDVLAFNPKVSEFFMAEYRFQTIISDIYKIIGDASEFDTSFLSE